MITFYVQDAVGSVLNQLAANPDLTRLSLPAIFQYREFFVLSELFFFFFF